MNSSFSRFLKSLGIGDLFSGDGRGEGGRGCSLAFAGTDTVFFQDLWVAAVRDAAEDGGRGDTS